MKRFGAIAFVLMLIAGAALAEGEEKPFLQFAKGNFWKYDVVEHGRKLSGKLEVEKIIKEGTAKLKVIDMGMGGPDEMNWKITGDLLTWEFEMMPGFKFAWKMLKFNAKKDDSWSSDLTPPKMGGQNDMPLPEAKMVIKSTVVGVEDVKTPAGEFKGCIKVKHLPQKRPGKDEPIFMWWARGVGLVKFELKDNGDMETSWILTSYRVGPDISDEKLKEMVKKADVVAYVTVPKEGAGAKKVQVKLAGLYKGQPEEKEGEIVIMQPREGKGFAGFEEGDFVVFLKKEGEALVLLHGAVRAGEDFLDRLAKLLTPPEASLEKMKEFCDKAQIVVGVEIVVLEDRGSFKYYVAKVIGRAKGAAGRQYLDVLHLPGMELEKEKKYILFLVNAEESGRKIARPVDVVKGILDYDEGLLGKLEEISKGSK